MECRNSEQRLETETEEFRREGILYEYVKCYAVYKSHDCDKIYAGGHGPQRGPTTTRRLRPAAAFWSGQAVQALTEEGDRYYSVLVRLSSVSSFPKSFDKSRHRSSFVANLVPRVGSSHGLNAGLPYRVGRLYRGDFW
ncbi:hypothetical protein AXG93_4332s1250 [Marchantia polymorpha subsp. ruderalis]|uniref:Uncharacterized protein n=1 Tax=Marchantia polymorpha subsp. ruderalis TaxID=1480154 RepID=A0A176W2F0_MARPO|nr:hypothetical protein AXG93_4332s1250 [Marchantia polymorpha subsp. ruderalis]